MIAEANLEIPAEKFSAAKHNGMITITSPTGQHRTFKIRTQKEDAKFAPNERIVSLLSGPDRAEDWTGFGFVKGDRILIWKSKRHPLFETYGRMLENPAPFMAKGARYLIEGRCRNCNRVLTHPESIDTGLGPVCGGRE